jgi:hypothetical protein
MITYHVIFSDQDPSHSTGSGDDQAIALANQNLTTRNYRGRSSQRGAGQGFTVRRASRQAGGKPVPGRASEAERLGVRPANDEEPMMGLISFMRFENLN